MSLFENTNATSNDLRLNYNSGEVEFKHRILFWNIWRPLRVTKKITITYRDGWLAYPGQNLSRSVTLEKDNIISYKLTRTRVPGSLDGLFQAIVRDYEICGYEVKRKHEKTIYSI